MKRIFFYATVDDLKPVLRRAEFNAALKFVPTGMRDEPNRPIYLRSSDLPIGVLSGVEIKAPPIYMVSLRDTKNVLEKIRCDDGRLRWLLSNGDNPNSVLLTPGGVCETGTLLAGEISTLHSTPVAQQIMSWMYEAVQAEHFTDVDIRWLGRQALEMLRAGRRLTQSEQSPPDFDFRLPESFGRP